jgi:type I restriction enzyme S subunit
MLPLRDLVTPVSRQVAVSDLHEVRYAGVRWYAAGVYAREVVPACEVKASKLWTLRSGDIVYNRMWASKASFGVAGADVDGCHVTNDFPMFRAVPHRMLPGFVSLVFETEEFQSEADARATGTTERRRLKETDFLAIRVVAPPLDVQRRIVNLVGALDTIIAAGESLVAHNDATWWRLAEALERDVADSERATLGSICAISGGLTKNAKDLERPGLVEAPYLRVANVHRRHLDLSAVSTIAVSPQKLDALRLQPGDILMNEGGDKDKLGRGAVWKGQIEDCVHQNHVFRARVIDGGFDPHFISAWANSFGQRWFETYRTQTTGIASISKATLSRFPVPAISLSRQREWSGLLGAVDVLQECEKDEVARLRLFRAALLPALLSGVLDIPTSYDELVGAL